MIVAVVQLKISPSSRSETLQSAIRNIDRAAEMDPSPDLIVLPAFGDTYQALSKVRKTRYEQMPGVTTATCGLRARNWGVFIAHGSADSSRGEQPFLAGMLLDRDGDVRVLNRMSQPDSILNSMFSASTTPIASAKILLGKLTVLTGDDILNDDCWSAATKSGAQAIIGVTCWTERDSDDVGQTLSGLAKKYERPCFVADATTGDSACKPVCPGYSKIVDAAGNIVQSATAGKPAILLADIEPAEAMPEPLETAPPIENSEEDE